MILKASAIAPGLYFSALHPGVGVVEISFNAE